MQPVESGIKLSPSEVYEAVVNPEMFPDLVSELAPQLTMYAEQRISRSLTRRSARAILNRLDESDQTPIFFIGQDRLAVLVSYFINLAAQHRQYAEDAPDGGFHDIEVAIQYEDKARQLERAS